MAEPTAPANYVKKETMLLVAAVCLLVGFVSGVVFSVFKLDTGEEKQAATQQEAGAPGQPQVTPEQARQIADLEKEVAADPKNVQALIDLGHLYFDTGESEKAIQAYTRALAITPDNPEVLTDLGVMYRRVGQYDKALQVFDKAIALSPTLPQPRFNKGVVLMFDLNRPQEALQAWEELLKIDPKATAPNGQPLREIVDHYRKELQQSGKQGQQQAPVPAGK
ncbi:MAG: tetratricopeptide repeat protein [Desulfobacteraceae bacterium]|nr:tetratricopeptide repeat protein [Desulfobacteraceae bacterium]